LTSFILMNLSPENLIALMNSWAPELIWVLMLIVCFSAVLFLYRFFGAAGLYSYISIAVIGANIQVLKTVQFSVYPEPVALGTILFASAFLATDILAEHFGKEAARKGIWLGFCTFLFFTIFMVLNLGFSPLTEEQAGEAMSWALPYHDYMVALFTPQVAFFAAGMVAYLISQMHDVWFFHWLKEKFNGKHLWLRNNLSTMVSALIDNTIFSVLAWIVFATQALPIDTVIFTYILGTYWLRLIVAVLDTPFVYLARHWKPKHV